MSKNAKYTVIRDTREQRGWNFDASDRCLGTQIGTLKTGDYSLLGFEDQFVIERKGSPAELATNLFQKRFHAELARLDKFKHAYLFLEFGMEHVINFPHLSGVPEKFKQHLKMTPQLFLMRLHEIQIEHPGLKVLFVGKYGREVASSLFKRVVDASK